MLRRTVETALADRTAIGIVEGKPGVGKTRPLEEAAAVAGQHGALVVWGSCLEGDGPPSMWPWEQERSFQGGQGPGVVAPGP